MTLITVKAFAGLKPIIKPRLLSETDAQVAQNVRLVSGSIEPLRAPSTLKTSFLLSPKTIYRFGNSVNETDYWIELAQDTDLMRSPVPGDQWDRLYWSNGSGLPRYADGTMVVSGLPNLSLSYPLGIQAPSTAITISSFSAPITYTRVSREYVMTFYNPTTAKESLPTKALGVMSVDGQKVSFTGLTTDNLGDAGATKKRIYRKVSGTFRLLVELDLTTTTYDDVTTDADAALLPALSGSGVYIQAPTRAPSVSTPTAAAAIESQQRQYVYTITNVYASGGSGFTYYDESQPSAAATITADATQTVTISGMSATSINPNLLGGSAFRVYRKDADSSQYLFVAEVPIAQTSVQDPVGSTTLGAPLGYSAPAGVYPSTPTVSATTSTATSLKQRAYMVTWADASGNESGKGPASATIAAVDGSTVVSITHSETVPAGATKKRLYRQSATQSGSTLAFSDANWKLVTEATPSTTSFSDSSPDSALTIGLPAALQNIPPTPVGTPGANATVPADTIPETRTYVYTYVSKYGEEGPPSDASTLASIDPAQPVTITVPGGAPAANITLKRIYRSSTVGSLAQFQYVDEIAVGMTTYTDSKKQAELGEVLMTDDWTPPPENLQGLRMMANGAAVGFVGRTIHLSEPNLPHAWPHSYTIDEDIVGIGVFGQTVAVMTKSYPFLLQGADPAAMTPTKVEVPQACVSKRSIVETGDGVMYASPDGYVSLGASIGVLTQNMYSRDQWAALNPSSMECYLYNGRIHCFYTATSGTRGAIILDPTGQGAVLTTSDISQTAAVSAGFYDAKSDTLYLSQSGAIVRFDQGSPLKATWRSKLYRLPNQQNFSVAQVIASTYPLTMRVYADGVLKQTRVVESAEHFTLPAGFRARDWEFEIETSSGVLTEVSEVNLATSVTELRAS